MARFDGSWGRLRTVDLGLFDRRKSVVIGIDQSLENFALAAYSPEDGTAFLWLFNPGEFGVRRLLNIQSFVRQTVSQIVLRCGEPLMVCMEGYSYGSQMAREKMGECGAATKLGLISALGVCKEVAFPTIVAPQPVKKFATGSAQAKKAEMIKAVFKKWGVDVSDDNLADSYALARIAAGLYDLGHVELAYEREVLSKLVRHTEWEAVPKVRAGRARR